MRQFPLLAQPGRVGPMRLRNRVVMAPMGTNYSTTDGLSTERDKMYYAERARGGVAMIMTEAMVVTEHARPHHNSLCCYHDRFIPGLASIVEAIKSHGAYVCGQLNHRGALLRRSVLNMEPVGPSPWKNPNTGDAVRPLTIAEIVEIQKLFVDSARRLMHAGYDGVEVHAGNGYLFQQFFTPRINKRTDRYGGSFDNRARFTLETIDRLKNELPDFPLIVRLSASEFTEGSYSQEEIVELSRRLERAGVAALDISGGSNESPQLSKYCIQPPSFGRRCLAEHSKPIKNAVSIPVLVAGRLVDPEDAESVLKDECADFVSVGRALYTDPHWCLKAFGQVKASIRKCIACNVCFERLTLEKDVACVHNPVIGTEFEALEYAEPQLFPTVRAAHPRRVLVLGGGVSGFEAARVLAGRGHEVELWEKTARAGGQMPLAIAAPDKREVEPVWSYRVEAVEALGIPVRYSVSVTAETVRAHAPDFVVVATGARPRPSPFDVTRLEKHITIAHAWDILAAPDAVPAGSSVTIIGGGMVGMETADLLSVRGIRCTVVEMLGNVAVGMARNNRTELIERVVARGTRILTETRVADAAGAALEVADANGTTTTLDIGDFLIIATGPVSDKEAPRACEDAGVPYALVGDANKPGDFLTCLRDAWMVALSVDRRFCQTQHSPAEALS
jgi:2,4-dienoyl-CoA reductase-like NADH-dependent reductase (Old Yellow Enzyme family)/NADPH-dependent 2,4-dienoyl-CoA reductase/sulfur reductase-like enzyme